MGAAAAPMGSPRGLQYGHLSAGGEEEAGFTWVHIYGSSAGEAVGSCGIGPEPGKDKGTQGERREQL